MQVIEATADGRKGAPVGNVFINLDLATQVV